MAATVLSAVLVGHDLGERSFWYDEAFTVGLVDRSFGDFLWRAANWEVNQSAYYMVFAGWFRVDQGEVFLRWLSGGFAVATVPVLYLLGRRLFGAPAGAIAAVVFAVNAFVLQWAQQLRAYTLVVLLVTLSTFLLVRAVERPSHARALLYALAAALSVYAHFFAGIVVAVQGLSLLALRPRPWRFGLVAGAALAVMVAPLAAFFATRQGDTLAWVDEPDGQQLVDTLADLAGGGPQHPWVYGGALVVGVAAAVAGGRRSRSAHPGWCYALPVLWLVLPIAAVVASSYTVKPLLVPRFLIVVVPAAALLVGLGAARLPRWWLTAPALGAVAWVSIMGLGEWYKGTSYEDWRGATEEVTAGFERGDDLLVFPPRADYAVEYYADQQGVELAEPILPATDPAAAPAARTLWVVERLSQGGPGLADMADFVAWRDRHYELADEQPYINLVVLRYERRLVSLPAP